MESAKDITESGSQLQDDQPKKSSYDQMSKEELIQKCKNLLMLAHKAKLTIDENKKFKIKLSEYETQKDADKKSLLTMKEMVDSLTENKIALTSQISELKMTIKNFEESSSNGDIENESLKRQVSRLTNENEDLINDLQKMDENLKKVSEFGKQQKIDLEMLEQQTNKLQTNFDTMKNENSALKEEIIKLNEKDNILSAQTENFKVLQKENECLKQQELKQAEKIQYLKNRLIEISGKLKKLKVCRAVLLQTQIEYSDSVAKWQKDISNASQKLMKRIHYLETKLKSYENQTNNRDQQNIFVANFESKIQELLICCDNAIKEFNLKSLNVKELTQDLENSNRLLKNLQKEFDQQSIQLEKMTLIKNENVTVEEQLLLKYEMKIAELKKHCDHAIQEFMDKSNEAADLQIKMNEMKLVNDNLNCELNNMKEEFKMIDLNANIPDDSKIENEALKEKNSNLRENIKKCNRENEEIKANLIKTTKDLENLQESMNDLRGSHDEQQMKIHQFESLKKSLQQEIGDLKKSLEDGKMKFKGALYEKSQTIERMKVENSELLSEMRELNEALKGRGDVISRQQDKILELEEISKLVNSSSTKPLNPDNGFNIDSPVKIMVQEANQSANNITNNTRFLDNQSEILSVSSISRAEDSIRMREVDESIEEKYLKLRSIAIKLKKKVQEQKVQIENLEKDNSDGCNSSASKMGTLQMKNLQALQNENDRLLDEIENEKKIVKSKDNEIKELNEKIISLKNNLAKLNENLKTMEKISSDKEAAVLQFQKDIKSMKQEKEAFNLIRKELEKDRDNLKKVIEEKEKEKIKIKEEMDKSKKEMEKLKVFGKQSNVLNLEIQAYEKSLNDASQKMETLKAQNKELMELTKSKEETNSSLKLEIKLLEENIESEKLHSQELKQQIDNQLQKLKQIEHDKTEMQKRLQDLTQENELKKSEIEESHLNLSEISAEKERICISLQAEQKTLYQHQIELEETLETVTNKLKHTEHELEAIRTEYTSYKIRAQSVLRQNQSKETSRECELEEELVTLQANREVLNSKLAKLEEQKELYVNQIDELNSVNETIQKRNKELLNILEESRVQNEKIHDDNQQQIGQNQNLIKTLRSQIEKLNKCYKQQLEDLETKHALEIEELKKQHNFSDDKKLQSRSGPFGGVGPSSNISAISGFNNNFKSPDEQKIDLILMEREDAEGSEASYSLPRRKISSTRSKHDLIPLDELLNSSLDESPREYIEERSVSPTVELQVAKEKLIAQESRIRHLTTLLAETEQDLIKFTQMNEHLKEEFRRHERSVEREKHVHNSEYLKNVVLKFLTLHSGDERTRLVPVLNTILKLSPEETHELQNVARGIDISNRSWGSYIPIWSNHQ